MSVIQGKPELGLFADQEVNIVGKILGIDKAFKAVGAKVFLQTDL
jgi:hypothetical protein